MQITKFYDPQAGESRVQIGGEISFSDVLNGLSEQANPAPENQETEQKEEQKQDIPDVGKTELKTEPQEQKQEEKKEDIPAKPIQEPDWKEIISKQDRKQVNEFLQIDEDALNLSKELKEDEFVKKLITYRKEHGNINPFIEAATKDWDKFSHEQLILDDLKKQYSSLSPEKAEKIARAEFNSKYNFKADESLTDEENNEAAELKAIQLEAQAERIRQIRKEEQKNFLDSVKPVDKNAELQRQMQENQTKAQAEALAFKAQVESHPFTTRLQTEKTINLGASEKSFKYTVNPDVIKGQIYDVNKFDDLFWKDGKFDVEKWSKVAAYANDISGFEDSLINHGMSLGTKNIVEGELENAKPIKQNQAQPTDKKSIAKAFATEGQAITLADIM